MDYNLVFIIILPSLSYLVYFWVPSGQQLNALQEDTSEELKEGPNRWSKQTKGPGNKVVSTTFSWSQPKEKETYSQLK